MPRKTDEDRQFMMYIHPITLGFAPHDLDDLDPEEFPEVNFVKYPTGERIKDEHPAAGEEFKIKYPVGGLKSAEMERKKDAFGRPVPGPTGLEIADPLKYRKDVGKQYLGEREIQAQSEQLLFQFPVSNIKATQSTEPSLLSDLEFRELNNFRERVLEKKKRLYEDRIENYDHNQHLVQSQETIQRAAVVHEDNVLKHEYPSMWMGRRIKKDAQEKLQEIEQDPEFKALQIDVPRLLTWPAEYLHALYQLDDASTKINGPRVIPPVSLKTQDEIDAQEGRVNIGKLIPLVDFNWEVGGRLNMPLSLDWWRQTGRQAWGTVTGGEDAAQMVGGILGWIGGGRLARPLLLKNYGKKLKDRYNVKVVNAPVKGLPKTLLNIPMTDRRWAALGQSGGAALGGGSAIMLHDQYEDMLRERLQLMPNENEKKLKDRVFDGAKQELLLSIFGHTLGAAGTGAGRLIEYAMVKTKGHARKLMKYADTHGIPLSLAHISDSSFFKQMIPKVFGRFPLSDYPYKKGLQNTYVQSEKTINKRLNELGPTRSMTDLSMEINIASKKAFNDMIHQSSKMYQDAYATANLLPEAFRNFVPTHNVRIFSKNLKENITKNILRSSKSMDKYNETINLSFDELAGLKGITPDQKEVVKFVQHLDDLPSHVSLQQYANLKSSLNGLFQKYGKNTDLMVQWKALSKAMELDRGQITVGALIKGKKLEKLKQRGFVKQKLKLNPENPELDEWVEAAAGDRGAVWRNPNTGMTYNESYVDEFFAKQMKEAGIENLSPQAIQEARKNLYLSVESLKTADLHLLKGTEKYMKKKATEAFKKVDKNTFTAIQDHFNAHGSLEVDQIYSALTRNMFSKEATPMTIASMRAVFPAGPIGDDISRKILKKKFHEAHELAYQAPTKESAAVLGGKPMKLFNVNTYKKALGITDGENGYRLIEESLLRSQGGGTKLNKQSLKFLQGVKDHIALLETVGQMPVPEASTFVSRAAVFAMGGAGGAGGFATTGTAEGAVGGMILPLVLMRMGSNMLNNPERTKRFLSVANMSRNELTGYFGRENGRRAFSEMLRYYQGEMGMVQDQGFNKALKDITDAENYKGVEAALEVLAISLRNPAPSYETDTDSPQTKSIDISPVLASLEKTFLPPKIDRLGELLEEDERSGRTEKPLPGAKIEDWQLKARPGVPEGYGRETVMGGPEGQRSYREQPQPQTKPTVMGKSTLPANIYGSMFPGDTLGAGIAQQQQTAQRPQRTSLMASGGIALATPAAELSGKVFENQAARNIMSTFYGTPMQQTVQDMLLTGTAKEGDPRPEGQVKLSTLYDQGRWTGAGPEPKGVSAPTGQEAWFTPSKPQTVHSSIDVLTGAWRGPAGMDPRGFMKPPVYGPGSIQGATMYTPPGKVTYEDIGPLASSASSIVQQDPSRYRVAGLKEGGILSTRSAKQMVA